MIDFLRITYLTILIILGIYSLISFNKGHKIIKTYAILTLIVELFSYSHLFIYSKPTSIGYNIYSIFEIILWLFYLKSLLPISFNILALIWLIYVPIFLQLGDFNMKNMNINGFLINNLLIIVCIIYYFYSILKNNSPLNGNFWIMIGSLFYNLGGFLITGIITLIVKKDASLASSIFNINIVLNIFCYSLFLFGIFKLNKLKPEGFN